MRTSIIALMACGVLVACGGGSGGSSGSTLPPPPPPPPPPPTNQAPAASASGPMTLDEAQTAMLDASASTDADGDSLTFSWEQLSGVSVTLSNASSSIASFTAPDVAADENLSFRVTVSDGTASSTASVDTTIINFLAADEVPDVIRFSAAEDELNGFVENRGPTFTLTADAATRLENIMRSGPDAAFFPGLDFVETAPNANGVKVITPVLIAGALFNFENPQDDNEDNVYEIDVSATFDGREVTTKIEFEITDVLDAAEKPAAAIIYGEGTRQSNRAGNDQMFGAPVEVISDITGDGKPEVAVSIQTGSGPAAAYIVTSESYDAAAPVIIDYAGDDMVDVRFNVTGTSTFPEFNYVSSANSSLGVDVLFSDESENRLVLIKNADASDMGTLQGTLDAGALAGAITYNFPASIKPFGKLIGDVNGDGLTDIFVRNMIPYVEHNEFGIIFGSNAAETNRMGDYDVTLQYSGDQLDVFDASKNKTFVRPVTLNVELVSDYDEDGLRELVIATPGFLKPVRNASGNDVLWIVKGSDIRQASAAAIDITSQEYERATNLAAFIDHDNDGVPSALLSIGSSTCIIDGNDLLSQPSSVSITDKGGRCLSIGGPMNVVSDLDDRGIPDIFFGRTLVAGEEFNAALGNTDSVDLKRMSFTLPFGYNQPKYFPGIELLGSELILLPSVNSDLSGGIAANFGALTFVEISDIAQAFEAGAPEFIVKVPRIP